jgi:hypothetical protein
LPGEQPSVIEHLEERLPPFTREILTNRLEPDLNTNVNRQTLGYSRYYNRRADKRKLKELQIMREKEDLLGVKSCDYVAVRAVA